MNDLTLIFIEHLVKRLENNDLLINRLRDELLQDARLRLNKYLLESTLYLSPRGKNFLSRTESWFQKATSVQSVSEMRILFKQLAAFELEADELYQETQQSLSSIGKLNADTLHVVFYEDQSNAKQRVYQAICLEMFRLVAANDGEVLSKLPLLHYEHSDLLSYYKYYSQKVLPALKLAEHHKRFSVWAFQYREQAKVGPLAKLPVYIHATPKQEKNVILPGEHHLVGSNSTEIWQGVGSITNLSPDNIQQAQFEGVYHSVSLQQLNTCRLTDTPTQILDQCFAGKWYAINPSHFFSMLSIALCSRTIKLRASHKQCLYCGSEGASSSLCLSCISKIRQKI